MTDAEDFYRAEAAYWHAQAEQLLSRIRDLFNIARQATLEGVPPEPPIGTEFVHARTGQVEWTRRADGRWECGSQPRHAYRGIGAEHGPKPCPNCPADWPDVAELLAGRLGVYVHRVLPGEQIPVAADGAK